MTEAKTPSSAGQSAQADASPLSDVYREIVQEAAQHPSPHRFLSSVLRKLGRHFQSPFAAIHVRYASEVIQEECHSGPSNPQFWKAALQQFLTEALAEHKAHSKILQARQGGATIAFIAAPFFDASGATIGSVALVLAPARREDVPAQLAALRCLAALASHGADSLTTGNGESSITGKPNGQPRSLSAKDTASAARHSTPMELAFTITNDLRNKLGVEQVSLGLVTCGRVRILSISGLDDVRPRSPGVAALRAAMEECLDSKQPRVSQEVPFGSDDGATTAYRLHRQWRAAVHGDSVASIPLSIADSPAAILSIRKRADQAFTPEEIQRIRDKVEPLAPALTLCQKASRSLLQHALDSGHTVYRALLGPGHPAFKGTFAAILLLTVAFIFGHIDYRVTVPCRIMPRQLRHVTAPFAGTLQTASVTHGDSVRQGDVLCMLDRRQFELERADLLAQIAVLEREADRAMSNQSPVDARLAQANKTLLETRLRIADRRIEQAVLRSPIDGVVIAGDLRTRLGSVIAQGDPLFQVAPFGAWTLEMEVPESSADELALGQLGSFATHAQPETFHSFRLTRLSADAEARDGSNVYVTEADLDLPSQTLRSGMEGMAAVAVGKKPVWWVVVHRMTDYLRMQLWL